MAGIKRGVVYACSHPAWLSETVRSACSVRDLMPELERELYLPRATILPREQSAAFTKIVGLSALTHPRRPRFDAFQATELDEVIFLDGDTLLLSPVPDLFESLKFFDLAVAVGVQYLHSRGIKTDIYNFLPPVPLTFPEWNTGVLAVRMSHEFRLFVREWSRWFGLCRERGFGMDQAAFRSVLVHSKLRVATLPNNWNFRAEKTQYVTGPVCILHAHGDLTAIARTINEERGHRLYQPDAKLVHGQVPKDYLDGARSSKVRVKRQLRGR
jgi:hypothetical protein